MDRRVKRTIERGNNLFDLPVGDGSARLLLTLLAVVVQLAALQLLPVMRHLDGVEYYDFKLCMNLLAIS